MKDESWVEHFSHPRRWLKSFFGNIEAGVISCTYSDSKWREESESVLEFTVG